MEKQDIRRRLNVMVYTKRITKKFIEEQSGLPMENINRALEGIISDRDVSRFTTYFKALDAGRLIKFAHQNRDVRPHRSPDTVLVNEIAWLAWQLSQRGIRVYFKNKIRLLETRKQNLLYYSYDSRLKQLLYKEFKEKYPKEKIWFHDHWNARKWVEIIGLIEEDH
jgi:hypothetical protein